MRQGDDRLGAIRLLERSERQGDPGRPEMEWTVVDSASLRGLTVRARTKSEARALAKKELGIGPNGRLPFGSIIIAAKQEA